MYGYLGDTADPDSVDYQGDMAFEQARIITPEERAQTEALIAVYRARQTELQSAVSSALTPIGKEFQRMILARDWDSLFDFLPPVWWGQYGILGKYSFTEQNGIRTYIPFTENDIRRFVYSPYYTVQPGHICTDEQRQMGIAALWKAMQTHAAKFPPTDWRHIWPIYPGWGYPGQRFGCEKYVPTTWVKLRTPVIAAAVIVATVYLGPIVADKIAGVATGKATGIVGAGTKAGAITTTTTVKAGASALSIKAGAITTAEAASFFQTVQSGSKELLSYVNKARTINAIANGEIPPPPISIVGDSFTDWAMLVAKEQIHKEAEAYAMQMGVEYIQKELTEREEAKLRAEIQAMQLELSRLIPANTSMSPDLQVPTLVQTKSAELALREKQAQDSMLIALAIAVPVGFLIFS